MTSKRRSANGRCVRVAAQQTDRRRGACDARARADRQHLARGVDAGDARRRARRAPSPRGRCRCRRRAPRAPATSPTKRGDDARLLRSAISSPIGPPKRSASNPSAIVRIGVVRVAVVGRLHATPRATCGRAARRRARRRPARALEVGLVAVPRLGQRLRAPTPIARPGRIVDGRAGSRRRRPSGVAAVRIATASSSTWVWVSSRVATIGRPGAQVLVDLQRRVGAAAARRDQHVAASRNCGISSAGRWPVKTTTSPTPAGARLRLRRLDLIRLARPRARTARRAASPARAPRGEQQVQPLIGLERAGVEHHRRVADRCPSSARSAAPAPAVGGSPEPGAFSISTVGTSGSMAAHHLVEVRADDDDDPRAPDHAARSTSSMPRTSGRDDVNAKLVSCCGRLECMSYRCGTPSMRRQHDADQAALLVRVDGVVASCRARAGSAVSASARSSGTLAHDGPMPMCRTNGGRRQRKTREPGQLDVAAERIRHQIDGVAERDQRADAVVFAERRAPGLEERLRRDHQDVHAAAAADEYTRPASDTGQFAGGARDPPTDRCTRRPIASSSNGPTHRRTGG